MNANQTSYTREITCFVNSAAVTNGYSDGIEWRNGWTQPLTRIPTPPLRMVHSSLYSSSSRSMNLLSQKIISMGNRPLKISHFSTLYNYLFISDIALYSNPKIYIYIYIYICARVRIVYNHKCYY